MDMGEGDSVKRIIAGLAILTGNLAEGRDYIDLFVPLISECIWSAKPTVVSVTDLQSRMKATYGMQIPQNALKLVLNRAAKRGYMRRQEGTYVPNLEVLASLNFATRYQDIIRQQDAAISRLVKFASDRFNVALTAADAENALLAHIQKHDLEILDCFLGGQTAPISKLESTPRLDYIVSSFIGECQKSDPEGFKYIDTIVKGHFLSHTLFFPDLDQVKRRFHRTEVYFDTALLLRILGYEGAARRDSCRELLDLLYQEGATLKCFHHTRDEVYSVLYGCMLTMQRGESEYTSPTLLHLRRMGYGASEVELELSLLDNRIEGSGIKVTDKPGYVSQWQIDEGKLDKALEDEREYWRDRPRQRKHDVDCLSAIYRLRKGCGSTHVEESVAIFVTANPILCKVGMDFFQREDYIDKGCVPAAITDYGLTALLWVKAPMAAPDLPAKFVIAECYAAVEPNEHLWRKYTQIASGLKENQKISSNEYYLLRYSQLAHKELMELTMGDDNMVTEGSVQEILETVKMEIRKEDLATLEKERRIHEEEKEGYLVTLQEERRLREETERKLEYEREVERRKWESLSQNIERKSRRIARGVSIGAFVVIMLLVSFGVLFGSIHWWGNWLNYALLVGYAVFLIFSVANLMSGVTIRDCISRLEVWLAQRIQQTLRRWVITHG
jgi:hypothetical protein